MRLRGLLGLLACYGGSLIAWAGRWDGTVDTPRTGHGVVSPQISPNDGPTDAGDPTDYAFNEEARRLLARIACERNRDAVSRLARQPHPAQEAMGGGGGGCRSEWDRWDVSRGQ